VYLKTHIDKICVKKKNILHAIDAQNTTQRAANLSQESLIVKKSIGIRNLTKKM
jgi:hypothetical protein